MKFGPVPVTQAEGMILGHKISNPDGKRVLRKGKHLSADDVSLLGAIGRVVIYIAKLVPGDIAVEKIAQTACG